VCVLDLLKVINCCNAKFNVWYNRGIKMKKIVQFVYFS